MIDDFHIKTFIYRDDFPSHVGCSCIEKVGTTTRHRLSDGVDLTALMPWFQAWRACVARRFFSPNIMGLGTCK